MTSWDSLFLVLVLASVGALLPITAAVVAWHGRDTPRVIGGVAVDMVMSVGEALSSTFGRRSGNDR